VVLSEEAPVPARLLFSPDRTRFIYEDESRYWLFDVPRRTTAPLTQATEYDLTLHWLDDDRLEVEVRGDPLCQGCGTTAQLARWQVRLPGAIPAQQPDDPCPELADRTPSGIVFDPAQEGDIIDQLAAGTLDYLNAGGAPAGLESALEHALPDAAPSSLTAGVAQARAAYRQAQQAYPPGTQGYQYAAMAGALFQTYEQTGSLDRACAAAERALQAAQGGDDPGIAYDDDPVHFGFYYESGIRYSADPDDLFAVPEGLRGMVHSPVCFGD
jgi:hypothetical protein